MRHHAPGSTHSDQVTQGIEDLTQRIHPLRSRFGHQGQIADTKTPLFITDIAGITLSLRLHPQPNAGMYLHCTDSSSKKLSTGSRPIFPNGVSVTERRSPRAYRSCASSSS